MERGSEKGGFIYGKGCVCTPYATLYRLLLTFTPASWGSARVAIGPFLLLSHMLRSLNASTLRYLGWSIS